MVNYRQIKITDFNNTDSIELNDFDGYLVTSPTGLGVYMKNAFLNVGSKRIKTDQQNAYQDINLTVDIYAKTREEVERKYIDLRNFIVKYREKGFRVYYSAYEGEERYIVCDIKTLDKTEKLRARYMSLPLLLEVRSYWKTDIQSSSTEQETQSGNVFQFNEDEDYEVFGEKYNIAQNITGSGNLTVVGYNFSKLPIQIKLDVIVAETFRVSFNNNDFEKVSDGVYISTKKYREISSGQNYGIIIPPIRQYVRCTIDLNNEIINISAVRTTPSYVPATVEFGYNANVISIQRDSASDVEEYAWYSVEPIHSQSLKGAQSKSGYLFVDSGKTEAHEDLSFTYREGDEDINGAYVIASGRMTGALGFRYVESADSSLAMRVDGLLYDAEVENHVVGLLEDEDIEGYYNVAFFFGSIVSNTIKNDGDNEIPLIIRLYGACNNPTVSLKDMNGNIVQTSKILTNVPANSYIEINSDAEETGVWLVYRATGVKINMVQYVDETTNMFITLPKGEYIVSVSDDDNNSVPTTVFFANEYIGA